MKNKLSIKFCQENLLTEKKYNELGKYFRISYALESQDASSLACARCGGNQARKFVQLREYNMRNIILEKSYTNVVDKLLPHPFLKNQNWAYLWINSLKFDIVCFLVFFVCHVEDYRNILKLSCKLLAVASYKVF